MTKTILKLQPDKNYNKKLRGLPRNLKLYRCLLCNRTNIFTPNEVHGKRRTCGCSKDHSVIITGDRLPERDWKKSIGLTKRTQHKTRSKKLIKPARPLYVKKLKTKASIICSKCTKRYWNNIFGINYCLCGHDKSEMFEDVMWDIETDKYISYLDIDGAYMLIYAGDELEAARARDAYIELSGIEQVVNGILEGEETTGKEYLNELRVRDPGEHKRLRELINEHILPWISPV